MGVVVVGRMLLGTAAVVVRRVGRVPVVVCAAVVLALPVMVLTIMMLTVMVLGLHRRLRVRSLIGGNGIACTGERGGDQ